MTYDEMCIEYSNSVDIFEHPIAEECTQIGVVGVKGLYKNGHIVIDKNLTNIEKKCILAEELGHHFTTTGNILDSRIGSNLKEERRAREWGALHLIQLEDFIRACAMYENIYQIAEELEVTIDVVQAFYDKICPTF